MPIAQIDIAQEYDGKKTRTPRFSWRSARRWRRWSCSA
jgi:hypothetical protein